MFLTCSIASLLCVGYDTVTAEAMKISLMGSDTISTVRNLTFLVLVTASTVHKWKKLAL